MPPRKKGAVGKLKTSLVSRVIREAIVSKKCSFFEHCSNGGGVKPMFKNYVGNCRVFWRYVKKTALFLKDGFPNAVSLRIHFGYLTPGRSHYRFLRRIPPIRGDPTSSATRFRGYSLVTISFVINHKPASYIIRLTHAMICM